MASNNIIDSDEDDFGTRPPFFNGEKYYIWKHRMQIFVQGTDFDAWKAIEHGPFVPTHIVDGFTKPKSKTEWTDDDKKMVHPDSRAKHLISCALCNDEFSTVMYCETAQEMWNTLRNIHEGIGEVKMARIGHLTSEFERFCMKPGENIHDMQMRFYDVVNHLASLGKKIPNEDLVSKVLRCLSKKWQHKVRAIAKSINLQPMLLVSLFRELEEHETELNRLDKNDEMYNKKKNSGRVGTSSRKDDEDDSDDSQEVNLVMKDLSKLLKKNKKSFKQGEKEHT